MRATIDGHWNSPLTSLHGLARGSLPSKSVETAGCPGKIVRMTTEPGGKTSTTREDDERVKNGAGSLAVWV